MSSSHGPDSLSETRVREGRSGRATAVVVAGMHRSGTSAMTRVLNLLGLDLPSVMYPAHDDNPLGYWEPLAVVEAHDEFLTAIGSSYDDESALPDSVFATRNAQAFEDRLVGLLDQEYADSQSFVVKDPRICRLVPIWCRALERFGAESYFVLLIRNPLEVAASLKERNGYTVTKSLLLWLRHVLEAERHTRSRPRSIAAYEDLLRDWRSSLDRIAFELGVVWPRSSHTAHAEIEAFLSPRRRHHTFAEHEVVVRPDVGEWIKRTYGALSAAADGQVLDVAELDSVRSELDRADSVFGPLLAERSLRLGARDRDVAAAAAAQADLEARLSERETELEALARDLESAREVAQSHSREVAALNGTLGRMEPQLQQAWSERERLLTDLSRRERALAASAQERDEAVARITEIALELETAKSALAARESDAQALLDERAELEAARRRIDELESEIAAQGAVAAAGAAELQRALEETERLVADERALRESLATRESELEAIRARLEESSVLLEARTETLAERERALAAMRVEVETFKTQAETWERAASERNDELGSLRARTDELDRLVGVQQRQIEDLQTSRSQAVEQASALAGRLSAADAELLDHAVHRRDLLSRLTARDVDLTDSRKNLEQALAENTDLRAHIAELGAETVALRRRLDDAQRAHGERDVIVRGQRAELDEATRELSAIRTTLEFERSQAAAAREAADRVDAQLRAVERERDERSRTIASLELNVREQTAQLERARDELASTDLEVTALRDELTCLRGELAAARGELDAERTRGTATVNDLARVTDELRAAEQDREDRERHVASLEALLAEQGARLEAQAEEIAALSKRWWRLRRASAPKTATFAFPSERNVIVRRWRAWSQFGSWFVHLRGGGLDHLRRYRELRREGTFDRREYLDLYPDVRAAGLDPLMHYVEHGLREGRVLVRRPVSSGHADGDPTLMPGPQSSVVLSPPLAEPAGLDDPPGAEEMLDAARLSPVLVSSPSASVHVPPRARARSLGKMASAARATTRGADLSDFVILLARQRSGTNALRSVLNTHEDIFCLNEVFSVIDRDSDDPAVREVNFFNFADKHGLDAARPDQTIDHARLFVEFLEYLRCFSPKKFTVVDVKYNTSHLLTEPWSRNFTSPLLFDLIVEHDMKVLNISRANYLRYVLSNEKALRTGRWHTWPTVKDYFDEAIDLDVDSLMREFDGARDEDAAVRKRFSDYSGYFAWEYADLFSPRDGTVSTEFLSAFAGFLDVPDEFVAEPEFTRQSSLSLASSIVNFDEVEQALRGSRYEHFLKDEPAYRSDAAENLPEESPPAVADELAARRGDQTGWDSIIGSRPEEFCNNLFAQRGTWVTGSLSHDDGYFLFNETLASAPELAIEIGTASGFSTAVLCWALEYAHRAGLVGDEYAVITYDIDPNVYFDKARLVGDAAREILPPELLSKVRFRNPATAVDVAKEHSPDSIPFLFLDASHVHPWPSLDLLAALPALQPGGTVVLHDINLPVLSPQFQAWGVKFLFDNLRVAKYTSPAARPNIGAFRVPDDKGGLRDQLKTLIARFDWEVQIADAVIAAHGFDNIA